MKKPDDSSHQPQQSITRRDATGHLNPKYEQELLEESRATQNDGGTAEAFILRPRSAEQLTEELGEAYVEAATTGEDALTERQDRVVPEEQGGPFVLSSDADEFAAGTDGSNIPEATREPFPKTSKAGR
jgi:hypothetical protein